MSKLLIVEDDQNLCEGLGFFFTSEGYQIEKTSLIQTAEQILKTESIDCIILDCNLPDGNGFDFCKNIRKTSAIPILMLTARDLETDEVAGLELGADDYITKPFSLSVLKARVKSVLRRKTNHSAYTYSNHIKLDKTSFKAYKNDVELALSTIEYKLLSYLIENKGQILLKEQILSFIWDTEDNFVDPNIVSVNIRRLRMKIEDNPAEPLYIKTAYGMGYLWNEVG